MNPSLFPNLSSFPKTRFQGSKFKLLDWIWQELSELPFQTCLDAFGGTASVAYRLKQEGKQVTYNDFLLFNFYIGKAFIENNHEQLSHAELERLLAEPSSSNYPRFIQETFKDIYFTEEENAWLDRILANFSTLKSPNTFALAFFALCQACLVKRPYNLFHRKNLYLRFAEVTRSFGNKASWDRPFEDWFRQFVAQANQAVFSNGLSHFAQNQDVFALDHSYDLVYLDPPYLSRRGVGVNYLDFYHFLEGMADYSNWATKIDYRSKNLRFKATAPLSPWTQKAEIEGAFEALFEKFRASILVVSYRSDGIPSTERLMELLKKYKPQVRLCSYGQYQYALSKNKQSQEILLIGL